MHRSKIFVALSLMAGASQAAEPVDWITTIDPTLYNGASGFIRFNDWGYEGPAGAGAGDFAVTSPVTGVTGFDETRVGQIQNVVTTGPDWVTSDPAHNVAGDFGGPDYSNANMDSTVNFFAWAYTTIAGSTFSNMTIDRAGNYFVARNDMNFQFYDTFQYRDITGVNPDQTYDTVVNFQPYAISDARGWCGSVLSSDPNALEMMAGQVTFDFAFDAYLWDGGPLSGGGTGIGAPMTQIVPDFVMRSYGSYEVDVTVNGIRQYYEGSAVVNNTDPLTGELDADWQNRVSFLGAGVIPRGVWVFNRGTADLAVADVQGENGTIDGQVREDGAVWHVNGFAGYAFLLRADGSRELFHVDPNFSDYAVAAVPVPAAAWLMGSGMVGLLALARRRSKRSLLVSGSPH